MAKAREAHLKALEEAFKKAKKEEAPKVEEPKAEEPKVEEAPEEPKKQIFLSPLHFIYTHGSPVGYHGELAPLDVDGKVLETLEVQHAKFRHLQAHEHAKAIAARHPPKPEDNNLL